MTVQLDVHELLGPELVSNGDGGKLTKVPSSDLKGKYVGIYFSAHWFAHAPINVISIINMCPPCRQFTPALANTYSELCKRNTNFQIVFVSGDRSEEQFEEYFASMPWLAVPFENAGARQQLMSRLNVMGIPCLAVVDPDGNVVCGNARAAVVRDPEGEAFPWSGQDAADSMFDWQSPRFWIMLFAVLYLLYNYFK